MNLRSIAVSFTVAALASTLAGCSGGSVKITPVPGGSGEAVSTTAHGTGKLVMSIRVPARTPQSHRTPQYISPATEGITVAVTGNATVNETVGLTPTSPGCSVSAGTRSCTVSLPMRACPSTANCYVASVATYDKVACSGSTCTIPAGAHELSANQDIGFTIAAGKNNTVGIVLDGVPASVSVVPLAGSTLSATSAGHFTISKCLTSPQQVSVLGVDAAGNDIVGPGSPTNATLTSDDTTHLAVATPAPSASPNVFTLSPPSTLAASTIPNAGSVVHLSASVTPLGTNPSAQSSTITVQFNADICGILTQYNALNTAQVMSESHDIPVDATIGRGAKPSWFTEHGTSGHPIVGERLIEFTAGVGGTPTAIALGSDANLWYLLAGGEEIARLTTSGTVAKYIPLPYLTSPEGLAPGPDGNLWFTNFGRSTVGHITTSGNSAGTQLSLTSGSGPYGIAAGGDGALWFTEYDATKIGRIDPMTQAITEFPIASGNQPLAVTAGSDSALWFTEPQANAIGRIPLAATTSSPQVTEYTVPTSGAQPYGITLGPDSNAWFTEPGTGNVARITPSGTITEFSLGLAATTQPSYIVNGPDGALWFTYSLAGADAIERVTTSGVLTSYPLPQIGGHDTNPWGITVGPDGALWFTESNASVNQIGRLQ